MRKFIIWLQVLLQLLMPVVLSGARAAPSPFSADRGQEPNSSQVPSRHFSSDGTGGDATGMATGMASSAAGNAVENWLRQFGTAQVNLRSDTRLSTLEGSSLDLLIPLLDTPDNVFFTQGGVRYSDDRVTTNLGLGHRHFTGSWMFGYNAFYDATWNNVNRRWGLGLEAWRDNLRLSSNLYRGITGWHASRQHDGYDERPADGWDVRVDGWLPALPQVGMKAVYEQYYGNNVALFNSFSDRQNNPHAVTLGLNYTPVPLITVGVEQKMGKGGVNDTQFTAGLNYRIGEPWSKQVSPAAVAALRDISNSRLELVNRNNEIVLDYRKQTELKLSFPARLSGEEGAAVTFTPTVKASNGLDHLELDDSALLQAGGQVLSVSNGAITVRMPAYQPQPVRLSGVAVDRKGNRSNIAETLLVTTQKETVLTLTTDKTQANADGSDAIVATLHLADRSGTALTDQTVTWRTTGGRLSAASGKTDGNGNTTVNLTSVTPGSFTITAAAGNKTATTGALRFTAEVLSPVIAVDRTSVTADSTDAATYTVTVKNAANQAVANQTVTWATNFGTLSAASGTTDANGQLQVKLTSGTAGQASVSATVAGQTLTAPVVTFVAEVPTAAIAVDKTSVTANGTDAATYTVTVKNAANQAVANQTVTWATNFGTLSAASGTTDANGQLQVKLTSGTAGQASVSATVAGQTLTAPVVTFVAEVPTAAIAVDKTSVTANGTDAATYTVTVKNAANQAVANQTVTWATNFGTLSAASGTTDANGQLQVKLTSGTAGQASVSATVAGQTLTAPVVTFVAEVPTAAIAVDKTSVTADSTDAATYTVTVKNAANQAVANQTVTWATNFGTLSAASGTTDANGQLQVKLTSGTAGQATVTAEVAGQTLTAQVVTFTAAPAEIGDITLDVDTQDLGTPGINLIGSLTAKYTTRYDSIQAGDVVELRFAGFDFRNTQYSGGPETRTVTAAEASAGEVVMGPHPEWLAGIDTNGSLFNNGTFTSTVTRPSTGESKSVSVTVTIDTQGSGG